MIAIGTIFNIKFVTRLILIVLLVSFCDTLLFAQTSNKADSSKVAVVLNDSLKAPSDTLGVKAKQKSESKTVDAEVVYSASDSIVLAPKGQKFYLYGDASVQYRDINLKAAYIELNMDSTTAYACGVKDSAGVVKGLPVFADKSGEYTMNTMKYNFKTQKAIIEHVVTQQGEGYIVSNRSKKMDKNVFYVKDGQYSTCDDHDHPHFYLNLTKAKFVPGKKIVTGPAYLVIEDVPIYPLFLPFAIIPNKTKYSSGILMPSYGTETQRGLFLRDGGYYWAASQYFDLATTGDIYTNGSWGLNVASKYKYKYHYSGNFNFKTITTIVSEVDLPDYKKTRDILFHLSHTPDSKANPYSTFSASVDYSTSSFEKNNIANLVNTQQLATNYKQSCIIYSKRFQDSPLSFSLNAQHKQSSRDTTIALTIPNATVTMSRVFPFKKKFGVGEERWYEKISVAYNGEAGNSIETKEYKLGSSSLANDWKNGTKHSIPVSMSLKFLKYFTSNPTFTYNERWCFKAISKTYDYEKKQVVNADTTNGFYRNYDYSMGIGTSTKTYLFIIPDKRIFGDKVTAFRHVMTPTVGYSFSPDFSSSKYGVYDKIQYYDAAKDTIEHLTYSRYESSLYGSSPQSKSGSLTFSLGNTLDMKVKSDKDSTGTKKIALLESLNFSSGYNFLADSLKFNTVNMSGRTSIFGTAINFGGTFDGYAMDTTKFGSPVRVNRSYYGQKGRLLRLQSANLSFGITLNNSKFQRKSEAKGKDDGTANDDGSTPGEQIFDPSDPLGLKQPKREEPERKPVKDNDGYAKFSIPWNLSINYSWRLGQYKFDKSSLTYKMKATSDVNLNGNVSLTAKWKIGFSTGYNFEYKELSQTNVNISKNLHCWNMSFNIVPTGRYKSFFFTIRVDSSMLQDLKYEKRSTPRDKAGFYR